MFISFRNQVAQYLSSAPSIDFDGVKKYVLLDSIRVKRNLFSETYQIGYFLTDEPTFVNFFDIEVKPNRLRHSSEKTCSQPLYTSGFNSLDGFDEACRLFELTAKEMYYLESN